MVAYEWTVETVDEHGDITDTCAWDSYAEAQKRAALERASGTRVEIALTRIVGDEIEGLQDRQYAYLEGGKLPERFDGGAKVPRRFHREVEA